LENKQVCDDIKLLGNHSEYGNSLTTANTQIINQLPQDQQNFIKRHGANYAKTQQSIERMQELGILVTTIPIKKQTLIEKKHMIKNFDQLLDVYNFWVSKNPSIGDAISKESLPLLIEQEKKTWNTDSKNSITSVPTSLA
jgi:hypothetical protein